MRSLYNLLLHLFLLLLWPVALVLLIHPGYSGRLRGRMGFGLGSLLREQQRQSIWIHALSVGEVTSALPLIQRLLNTSTFAIVLSSTTTSGMETARRLLPDEVPVIPAPLDHPLIIQAFIRAIRPPLFILVETDFWPNWLLRLNDAEVPTMLVNGRVSEQSAAAYRRFAPFCRALFRSFTLLGMQSAVDVERMQALGVERDRLLRLGNLKYAACAANTGQTNQGPELEELGFSRDAPLWVCGSTHHGEEALLLESFKALQNTIPDIQLLLAPRSPARSDQIAGLCAEKRLAVRKRSQGGQGPLLILDSLGELSGCYRHADIAFIGGSLVPEGGHNPIEPAAFGVPVLFGPHMEDFPEISAELLASNGAFQIDTAAALTVQVRELLTNETLRHQAGQAALDQVTLHTSVIDKHLVYIKRLLER
ncbi:MAG: hypothetical protein CSA34_01815 [Desulfobulbus propionicus]|nr:MAG: hypothetical protein CSA34_01815 [Desulfobulbus propionicus]